MLAHRQDKPIGSYRATYDIAAHYQREVLPLRRIIFDQGRSCRRTRCLSMCLPF